MIKRKSLLHGISRLCLATLLTLLATSGAAQSSGAEPSEGEIAIELFGLIAEQSGCAIYAVAWLDRATQQVYASCAETTQEAPQILASSGAQFRFVLNVSITREHYQKTSKSILPRRSASVLAYLLANTRVDHRSGHNRAPLLLYRDAADQEESVAISEINISSPAQNDHVIDVITNSSLQEKSLPPRRRSIR